MSERTSVSHYRLAAHLGLALLILAYFTTLTRSVFEGQRTLSLGKLGAAEFLRAKFPYVVALFALQIFYGAFVAGLKAGFAYNTFPLMAGSLFPTELFAWDPISRSALENPATVQWIHRALGTLTLLAANGLWWGVRRRENPGGELRYWAGLLAGATNLQFALGIATLLFVVPVPLGALHQFGAAILVVLLSVFSHASRRGLKKEPRSVNL